jgi:asparagine synthase (glutamine-hydrolysing)
MCGLTGFLGGDKTNFKKNSQQLKCMTDEIMHRGPDDEGFWIDEDYKVAIGHRRLSILDLSSAGHQPMHSTSGQYIIAFNGEIYNHLELRVRLNDESNSVIEWNGHSDTETLLLCFEVWGVDVTLQAIKGMFVIALYDTKHNSLYLIRDRMGEKPLYYGWSGNTFLFGSELKSLKAFQGFSAEIDRNALALFLKYDYVPSPFSIYKGISKLSQGSYIKISMVNDVWSQECVSSPNYYWSMNEVAKSGKGVNKFHGSDQDAIQKLDDLLYKSVKQQMISDVPLGAFLSGGIDSSVVVALMQKHSDRKVKTFTIGFNEKNYNEAEYAKKVALHLGTDHTELYITPVQALDVISRLSKIYDEPFADSSQIPTFLVSEMAKQHVTVSLSGDGGDELFGGYNRYFMANRIWKKIEKIPFTIRKLISRGITFLSPKAWDFLINSTYKFLPSSLRMSHPADKIYKLSRILTLKNIDEVYESLVSHWDNSFEVVIGSKKEANELDKDVDFLNPEDGMMFLDSITYLPDDILVKVDRTAMSVSLETRAPFLDKDVVEFAWQLPFNMKIRDSQGKWVLRKVLDKYVPKELIDRPKMGFGVPIDSWLRDPLRDWAEDLLSEKRLKDDGYFHVESIREKWNEHLSGHRNWQYHLWSVLMFQMWLDDQ